MARRHVSFSVHPKFSAGSGAGVSEEIALRVASQEKEEYERCLEGLYGEDKQLDAQQPNALRGIAEQLEEARGGWNVTDLITGEKYWRGPMKAGKVQVGDRLVEQRVTVTKQPAPYSGRLASLISIHGTFADGGPFTHAFLRTELLKIERPEKEP